MKNMDNFFYTKEAITWYHQIDTFHSQQRWMEHKGGHWLLHKEYLACIVVCQKASQAEATSNSEKIKLTALAIIELHLSEGFR